MKLFKRSVELVVIRDIFNPPILDENGKPIFETYQGNDIEKLLQEAFGGNGLSESVRLYHGDLSKDITPKTPQDVDKIMRLNGRIYAVVKPMGIETLIAVAISIVVSVAVAFLMPVPTLPNQNSSAAPSPNNALAARTNKQRLGGRIPDIFGTGYSYPDLTAVTYSVYIDHKEVEMSAYRIGRGKYDVKEAYDDTTPISQVFGSSVLVFDPDTTFDDTPAFQFGSAFTADEAEWSRKVAKRYTSVNGQTLQAPDSYLTVATTFKNPNIIETSSNADFRNNFAVGDTILVEGADNLASANGVTEGVDPDVTDVTYTLNGQYEILTVTEKQITLSNPAAVNSDWQTLTDNVDLTVESDAVTLSAETDTFWQGWHYTDLKEHESAYINITAPNGLYDGEPSGRWRALRLYGVIESEIVDVNNNPIANTLVTQQFSIQSPNSDGFTFEPKSVGGLGASVVVDRSYDVATTDSSDNKIRSTANKTVVIDNPNFSKGKRLRFRIARTSNVVTDSSGGIVDELKIKDFYGIRSMVASDYMPGTTNVLGKTLGTEGALSLKERKLRLLVQRYVQRALTSDGNPNLLKFENMEVWNNSMTQMRVGYFQDDRTLIIPEPDAHGQSAVFDFVAVQPGNTYTLSFQETNESSYIAGFILYDADKNIIEEPNLISGNLTTNFQYYRGYYSRSNQRATIRIDSDRVVFLRPRVGVYDSGANNTDGYFKDIKFELGASVTPWTHFADDLLVLSNRADDIYRHVATDPKIGNLQLSQVDIAQIKNEVDAQIAYFGTDKCSEFCYTFDDNNLSAEETMQLIGKAVFSQAKRQGNKIMLDFERVVPASVAVFNSHNILPDTFTASESLGIANDYDGVTVEYTDPIDDATVTLSYPGDNLINPHKDELIGVRNKVQAHIHMMRLYNKDRHAYKTCEFTAGDESNIVVRTNRITVADQLRANIQQGSVESIETVGSDIVLHTTDPVTIEPSVPHTLFIQTINNGVEAIEVTARDDYSVKLARLPSGEISRYGVDSVAPVYQIVKEEDKDRDAYLVSQKDPSEAMTNKLICTNYDDRYYQNDKDYINGLIA